MTSIHHSAASGYAVAAEVYAANRPDYPVALGLWLRDELALRSAPQVLDLGAGTGKFLPTLIALGVHIVAVEPVDAMRAILRARFPEIDARAGTATAIPCDDGAFDAVVCAQSFHWFANADALAEIHRVLKPGGSLVLVWNERDESVPWVAAISALLREVEGDTPRYHPGMETAFSGARFRCAGTYRFRESARRTGRAGDRWPHPFGELRRGLAARSARPTHAARA